MNRIKIMTYNVCWEALDAAKTSIDMTRCRTNTGNRCMIGIANIINKRLKKGYDFICLQEINSRQWNEMVPLMNLENYKIIKKEILPSGIMILYRDHYTLLRKYSGNLDSRSGKRPYIISLFSNNIVLINIHMPHTKQSSAFQILKDHLLSLLPYIDNQTIYIICGDFNKNQPLNHHSFRHLLDETDKKIIEEPREIKTCCVPNGQWYTGSFDHIFVSSNTRYTKYSTLHKKEKYMSDHLPVFGEIEY